MKVSFRQGIVSYQPGGSATAPAFLQVNGSGHVDLLAATRAFTVTVAHRTSDYLHSEDNSITNAWVKPAGGFATGTSYWLYIDFDTLTFARTFGHTTEEPMAQPTEPSGAVTGDHWYNTSTNRHFYYTGTRWVEVLRVFVARLFNGQFYSESIYGGSSYAGTQIGDTTSVYAGRVLFDQTNAPIQRTNGTFITSEDQFFMNQTRVESLRLESNVARGKTNSTTLAAHKVVAFRNNGVIQSATYDDVGSTVVGILLDSVIPAVGGAGSPLLPEEVDQSVGSVVVQGIVTNPSWSWPNVGASLWVDNSGTLVTIDPHLADVGTYPTKRVPVARVLSSDTIVFEQGLGGVGDRGARGPAGYQTPATTTVLGSVTLSVTSATETPVVVETTDPRLSDARTPLAHTHSEYVPIAGGTMTGLLVLSGDPSNALGAVTKQYADSLANGLIWLDPVDKINMISDAVSDPTSLTPEVGDAYITAGNGGAWSGITVGNVVTWDGSAWVDNGAVTDFTPSPARFIISATNITAAGGSFTGHENEIAIYDALGALTGFEVPVEYNALFVRSAESTHRYDQYVFNGTSWTLFSASHDHDRAATTITLDPYVGTNWGTLSNLSDEITATEVQAGMEDVVNTKAAKLPTYATAGNLPTASLVKGMYAYVDGDGAYVSNGTSWVALVQKDSTINLPYDFAFYVTGSMQSDTVVSSFMITRSITVKATAPGSIAYAKIPATDGTYTLEIWHTPVATGTPVQVGSIGFSVATALGVLTWVSDTSFVAGDLLEIKTPVGTPDSGLEQLSITLIGCAPTTQCTI